MRLHASCPYRVNLPLRKRAVNSILGFTVGEHLAHPDAGKPVVDGAIHTMGSPRDRGLRVVHRGQQAGGTGGARNLRLHARAVPVAAPRYWRITAPTPAHAVMNIEYDERLLWPDVLKIAAVFGVVLIHSAAPLLVGYERDGAAAWWAGNLYDSLVRWCIPVFVMLSGTFLIERTSRYGTVQFLRRRFGRILLPFLIWSVIYLLWRVHANGENIPASAFPAQILAGPVYYHLWFIYMLFGLYLLAPILGAYTSTASRNNLVYFLVLWAIFGSVLPTIEPFVGITLFPPKGTPYAVFKYVGYFLLGHLLRDSLLSAPKRSVFAALFFVGFCLTAVGTYYLSIVRNGGSFDSLLYEYYSLNVLLMAVAVYLVGKSVEPPPVLRRLEHRTGIVRLIAACVPGIYLVHAMVIAVLRRGMVGVVLGPTSFHPLLAVPFFALVVFSVSLIVVAAVRALPILRWSVP
ncbi:MAG: acyltransferase family protein [Chitinivibrionales bacterium]|nr:acyltransferase family protein [Chitinivibrionales bacterium]